MKFSFACKNLAKRAIVLGSVLALVTPMSSSAFAESNDSQASPVSTDKNNITQNVTKNADDTNIVYIILDDIGFSDLGSYGSEIKTPNIDLLAENGLRYTNFNACPLSSATRASLLTGRDNNAVGVGHVANVSMEMDRPGLQGGVTPSAALISEILKTNDYSSYGVGKWHIAPVNTVTPAGPFDYWPLAKGFDRYYGFMDGETDQYTPQLVNGNEMVTAPTTEGYNLNDDLLAHAKQYITDHASIYPEKGFFLNFAFGTGHSPQQVPQNYADAYKGVYDKGWDQIRLDRFEKQKELGIIPSDAKLAPADPTVKAWDTLSDEQKKLYIKFMENYAGYITQADEEIGKLISHLKSVGEYDNTIFVILGDNGASPEGGPDGTDSFFSAFGGRIATVEDLMPKYDLIGGPEMQALYPKGWAQVSNTPFAGYKGSTAAGALRNPLIISWENGILDKGTIRNQYVNVTDITPTVLEMVNADIPLRINGVNQMAMHGKSFTYTFSDENVLEAPRTAITYVSPKRAIYSDGWKAEAIHILGTSFDSDEWKLFNVKEDFTESLDVSKIYPEKLEELKALFEKEAYRKNIHPYKEVTPKDMGYTQSGSAADRKTFKYYPGVNTINVKAIPSVNTSHFTITVPVTINSKEDQGVLVAMGDEMGGYSLYVMNNKLTFVYNKYGDYTRITSDINVPLGKSEFKFDFTRTSMEGGKGKLYINNQLVGESDFKTAINLTLEGLDIGRDQYKATEVLYKDFGDFVFTGEFDYVKFDLKPFIPVNINH